MDSSLRCSKKVGNKDGRVFSFIVFHCDRISSKLHFNCRLGERGDRQKGPHFVLVHDILLHFSRKKEVFLKTLINGMYLRGRQISDPHHNCSHPA